MNNVKVYTTKNYSKVILVKMGDMKQLDMQKLFTECARQCARGFCYELFCAFLDFFIIIFSFLFCVHLLPLTVLSSLLYIITSHKPV
jgi:hypothetical protein